MFISNLSSIYPLIKGIIMKSKIIASTLLMFACFSISAETIDPLPENVQSIDEKPSGDFKVKCQDKSKGIISFEEDNICTHVKTNKNCEDTLDATESDSCLFSTQSPKNTCRTVYEWTVESAAGFICSE